MAKDPAPMFIPKRSGSSIHSAACAIVMSRRNTPPGRLAVPCKDEVEGGKRGYGRVQHTGNMRNKHKWESTVVWGRKKL